MVYRPGLESIPRGSPINDGVSLMADDDEDGQQHTTTPTPHPNPALYRAHVRCWFSSVAQSFQTPRPQGLQHVRVPTVLNSSLITWVNSYKNYYAHFMMRKLSYRRLNNLSRITQQTSSFLLLPLLHKERESERKKRKKGQGKENDGGRKGGGEGRKDTQ